jgi:hypothetical protein
MNVMLGGTDPTVVGQNPADIGGRQTALQAPTVGGGIQDQEPVRRRSRRRVPRAPHDCYRRLRFHTGNETGFVLESTGLNAVTEYRS